MPTDISPENEQFIQQQIATGMFRSRADAIDAGIELLRRRQELLDRIDLGRSQLDKGEFHEYDDRELEVRFDQLKERAQGSTGGQQRS